MAGTPQEARRISVWRRAISEAVKRYAQVGFRVDWVEVCPEDRELAGKVRSREVTQIRGVDLRDNEDLGPNQLKILSNRPENLREMCEEMGIPPEIISEID